MQNMQNSAYVQNMQNSAYVQIMQNSAYVQNMQNSTYVQNMQNSAYVQNMQNNLTAAIYLYILSYHCIIQINRKMRKDFLRKLMPTFCRKLQVASFYSSLKQPHTKLCHRQKDRQREWQTNRQTYWWYNLPSTSIISFAIFLLGKKICEALRASHSSA